ncbi:MAG: hypothetical protein ABEJ58_10360 [Halodesulfurarchaeum sp.]
MGESGRPGESGTRQAGRWGTRAARTDRGTDEQYRSIPPPDSRRFDTTTHSGRDGFTPGEADFDGLASNLGGDVTDEAPDTGRDGSIALLSRFQLHLWVLVIVFFGFGDLITTAIGLYPGSVIEAGPVPAALIQQFGVWIIVPLKILTVGLVAVVWRLSPKSYAVGVPLGLSVFGIVVTGWNVAVLIRVV